MALQDSPALMHVVAQSSPNAPRLQRELISQTGFEPSLTHDEGLKLGDACDVVSGGVVGDVGTDEGLVVGEVGCHVGDNVGSEDVMLPKPLLTVTVAVPEQAPDE